MGRYFSAIDRFLNKIRRKGFILYTAIVVAATFYTFYSVSNLPDVNQLKDLQERQKKQRKRIEDEKRKQLEDEQAATKEVREEKRKPRAKPEVKDQRIVDNWSRKKMHAYLGSNKIYPDVDTPIEELVAKVKSVQYENSFDHFI